MTKLKSQLDKLEKIKQQIKDEERKIEQDLGKLLLKSFDLTHADFSTAKELINELSLRQIKEEKEEATLNELDSHDNRRDVTYKNEHSTV